MSFLNSLLKVFVGDKSKKDLKDESELIIETNFATLKAKLREINDK